MTVLNLLGILLPLKTKPNNSQPPRHPYLETLEKQAIVDEIIYPYRCGRARFKDSIWPACCLDNTTVKAGVICEVVDIHNITLILKPISRDDQGEEFLCSKN